MSCTVTLKKNISFAQNSSQFLITLINEDCVDKTKDIEGKRSCKDHCKPNLVDYDSLPEFLKHNELVVNYYRSEWPLKQTIFSIFSVHNETLNIWTHLIGFFVFLALAMTMMASIDDAVQATDTLSSTNSTSWLPLKLHHEVQLLFEQETTLQLQVARWPFYAYLCGAMFCLLGSSVCHLVSCHSEHTCYMMLRLDYTGISALIVTSFYPLVYYTFTCDLFYRNLYMGFITVFGLASIMVSLMPVFERPEFRMVRAGLFACMGLSGLVPIMHKMIVFGDLPEAVVTTVYEVAMLCFYGLGVVVYVLRIPERWMPGKFDLVGHSHQLWHVLVIAGAYTHYLAALVYLSWRETEGC